MGVSTAPVEATVSATIDGTPTTVTENTISVPTTAETIVITAEAEGYTTGTYTFTNAVEQSAPAPDWLMLSEDQIMEQYKITPEVLTDGTTFLPAYWQDAITVSGTEGSNTTVAPSQMYHYNDTLSVQHYALTVGVKRQPAEEGYYFYPECQLDDRVTTATTGQASPHDSLGKEWPSTITVGSAVYDIYCFVYSDTSLRFHKVELKKRNTSTAEITVVATLTVDNTNATYEDYVPGN